MTSDSRVEAVARAIEQCSKFCKDPATLAQAAIEANDAWLKERQDRIEAMRRKHRHPDQ